VGEQEQARQEDALRALLERAVPYPPAPAQRLEGVRERIRRRRRRRAALTGGAVLAVAAGLVAVPGLVRTHDAAPAARHAAHSAPAAGGSATPTPTPPSPPPPGYRPDGMGGLVLQLPPDWRRLPDPATVSVFLSTSSQPLALPEGGCAHALDGFCTPLVRALGRGGALVMFKEQPGMSVMGGKLQGYAAGVTTDEPLTSCRAVGGTYQMSRTMVGPAGTPVLVWATACLAHPSKAQVAEVRELLATAAFG
jgi:hypothetical protein